MHELFQTSVVFYTKTTCYYKVSWSLKDTFWKKKLQFEIVLSWIIGHNTTLPSFLGAALNQANFLDKNGLNIQTVNFKMVFWKRFFLII